MYHSKLKYELKLVLIFSFALISLVIIEIFFTKYEERIDHNKMSEAVSLAEKWFGAIDQMKKERNISSDVKTNIKYSNLIGNEFTDLTTTLSSLGTKEISTNPNFAALILKYMTDSGIDSAKTVGIILSGSFPSLAISSLAAAQAMKVKAILFSSLGASMFGANQFGATWIDMECYLREKSNLKYRSSLITLGGENDNGGGLSGEGIRILKAIASNYNVDFYIPNSFKESVGKKVDILLKNKIDLLINVGGNQTGLGVCVHSSNIPNGLHSKIESCGDEDRGIILRLSEKGIPFINLLNIRSLAIDNDLSLNPSVVSSSSIYWERKIKKIPVAFSLFILSGLLLLIRKKCI